MHSPSVIWRLAVGDRLRAHETGGRKDTRVQNHGRISAVPPLKRSKTLGTTGSFFADVGHEQPNNGWKWPPRGPTWLKSMPPGSEFQGEFDSGPPNGCGSTPQRAACFQVIMCALSRFATQIRFVVSSAWAFFAVRCEQRRSEHASESAARPEGVGSEKG